MSYLNIEHEFFDEKVTFTVLEGGTLEKPAFYEYEVSKNAYGLGSSTEVEIIVGWVNGSICVNYPGQQPDASNFDAYAEHILNNFGTPNLVAHMVFNRDTLRYELVGDADHN